MNIAKIAGKAKVKLPNFKKIKFTRKTVIIMIAVLLVIACAVWFAVSKFAKDDAPKALSAFVTRGSVTKIIEGSGTIEAVEQYEITALVKGEILADHFEEGDEVEKGMLLYEIDTADIENNIEKSRASVEKSQLSYDQSRESVSNLTVRSSISGTVHQVYIKNGDNIGNNTKIADVVNSDYMRLKINFNHTDAVNMSAGQSAEVYLATSSAPIKGEVTSVATGAIISASGAPVTPVEIVVENPGAIKPGDTATAIVGDYACNDSGAFEYYETATITAKTSGEAYGLRIRTGDKIIAGDAIVYLDSTAAIVNARQSQLSLKDSQLALENLVEQREDYNITAPISGKVIQKNSKAGDKLDNGNSNTTMAIIADLSSLVFEISVDELDISNIKAGQTVTVTADALEGQRFMGHVENVSIVGSSSNGVTSYPVKVVMDTGLDRGLIPGMNVNASIVIDSREDVLRVPVSAVNRGNIVYVKSDSETAKNAAKALEKALAERADNPAGSKPSQMPSDDNKATSYSKSNVDSKSTADVKVSQDKTADGKSAGTDGATGDRPKFDASKMPGSTGERPAGTDGATGERPKFDASKMPGSTGERPAGTDGATGERPKFDASKMPGSTGERPAGTDGATGERPKFDASKMPGSTGEKTADAAAAKPATADGNNTGAKTDNNRSGNFGGGINTKLLEMMQKNAPEGYTAVVVEIGLTDSTFVEIVSGLAEGDEIYIPDTTSSATSGMGGMGGMPMGGMGGMSMGGNRSGMGGMGGMTNNRNSMGGNNRSGNTGGNRR